ncbi:hypothetical protein ACLB2K_025489 [Fragaria x ananassa]
MDWSSVPKLAYHFADGAVFEPPVSNFIAEINQPRTGQRCVSIVKSNTYTGSLIGNVMMQNYLWEFNIADETVGYSVSLLPIAPGSFVCSILDYLIHLLQIYMCVTA